METHLATSIEPIESAFVRAGFDARYRAFARARTPIGSEGYRDEALAFAKSVGSATARREARIVAAHGPRASFAIVRDGPHITVLMRWRRGTRLRVVQLFW